MPRLLLPTLALLLAACGQAGDLYLPSQAPPPKHSTLPGAAPAPPAADAPPVQPSATPSSTSGDGEEKKTLQPQPSQTNP